MYSARTQPYDRSLHIRLLHLLLEYAHVVLTFYCRSHIKTDVIYHAHNANCIVNKDLSERFCLYSSFLERYFVTIIAAGLGNICGQECCTFSTEREL